MRPKPAPSQTHSVHPRRASPIEQESYRQDKAVLLEEEADICSALTRAGADEVMALQTRLEAVRLNLADLEAHRYATTAEMIERYKALTPYLRIRTRTGLNFFSSDSREMIGLLNQYVREPLTWSISSPATPLWRG